MKTLHFVSNSLRWVKRNLMRLGVAVNDCFLSKTAKYCRKRSMFFLSSFALLQHAKRRAAISSGRHAVQLAEVVHKVSIRAEPDLLQHLLHVEKSSAQHLLRFAQPEFLQILSRTLAGFLLK